jgi:hypothetical protein
MRKGVKYYVLRFTNYSIKSHIFSVFARYFSPEISGKGIGLSNRLIIPQMFCLNEDFGVFEWGHKG